MCVYIGYASIYILSWFYRSSFLSFFSGNRLAVDNKKLTVQVCSRNETLKWNDASSGEKSASFHELVDKLMTQIKLSETTVFF